MFEKLLSKSKKDETASEDAPEKKVRTGGLSVPRVGLFIFTLALAVLGGAVFAAYLRFSAEVQEHARASVRAQAAVVGEHLVGRVASLTEVVAHFASNPALADAVAGGDPSAGSEWVGAVGSALPGVVRATVVTPAAQEPEGDTVPALGYACLDLVRQAEAGKSPAIELHFAGSPDEHLDIVRPIRSGGRVIGSLLVSLDPAQSAAWLREAVGTKGYAELNQSVGKNTLILSRAGRAALKGRGGDPVEVALPGTAWSLSYWTPEAAVVSDVQRFGFLSVFVAAAAILAIVLLGGIMVLGKLLRSDLGQLIDHFVGVFNGQRTHSVSMKLIEVQKAVRTMDETLPGGGASQRRFTPRAAEPEDSGYSVTEEAAQAEPAASDLMFMDRDSVSVDELPGLEFSEPEKGMGKGEE